MSCRASRVAVLAGLLAVSVAASGTAAGKPKPGGNETRRFTIAGAVDGELLPGLARPLELSIANPFPFSIDVVSLTATAGDAAASCGSANVVLGEFRGPVRVTRGGSATVLLEVSLRLDADDACQGVAFPLTFAATARRVPEYPPG